MSLMTEAGPARNTEPNPVESGEEGTRSSNNAPFTGTATLVDTGDCKQTSR
jgi:hypothetical protein